MPAGRLSSPDAPQHPDETPQTKRCTACQGPLNVDTTLTTTYAPESSETANYCIACRETRNAPRSPFILCATIPVVEDGACDIDLPRRILRNGRNGNLIAQINARHESESSGDEDVETLRLERDSFVLDTTRQNIPSVSHGDRSVPVPVPTSTLQHAHAQYIPSSPPVSPSHLLVHPASPIHRQTYSHNASSGETHPSRTYNREQNSAYPDPLADITRLRVRSKGYKCLQPGATFKGTQKSGRNSYDVNVTIVVSVVATEHTVAVANAFYIHSFHQDVDFASSFLCGYLRIRGLTDDWPELTTYFDAQIIGMRHGFDTQDWGASRQEDMVHWARFPAFRAMQKDLLEPRLTLPANTSRSAVFMRWKERFLVPDHRVQDISGASFAGTVSPIKSPLPIITKNVYCMQASTMFVLNSIRNHSLLLRRLRLCIRTFRFASKVGSHHIRQLPFMIPVFHKDAPGAMAQLDPYATRASRLQRRCLASISTRTLSRMFYSFPAL